MAEDFLPHPPPPPPEPAKSGSALRTFVIWLVLIVMFIAIYQVFTTNEGEAPRIGGYSGWWIAGAALVGFVLPWIWFVWQYGGHQKFNASQTEALTALADGQFTRAAELFEALAKQHRTRIQPWSIATYNHGYALLLGGDAGPAVGRLLAVVRAPKIGMAGVYGLASVQLARAFAIGGDADKAEKWLDSVRTQKLGLDNPVTARAALAAVEALVCARQGKYDEALATYADHWPAIESQLPIAQMREVWLIRAFATAMTSTPRDAGAAETSLRVLRATTRPGQLAWLTKHWPELAAFTETNELARAA